jgi:hypothetical protein
MRVIVPRCSGVKPTEVMVPGTKMRRRSDAELISLELSDDMGTSPCSRRERSFSFDANLLRAIRKLLSGVE